MGKNEACRRTTKRYEIHWDYCCEEKSCTNHGWVIDEFEPGEMEPGTQYGPYTTVNAAAVALARLAEEEKWPC